MRLSFCILRLCRDVLKLWNHRGGGRGEGGRQSVFCSFQAVENLVSFIQGQFENLSLAFLLLLYL